MELALETIKAIIFGAVENDGRDFYRMPLHRIERIQRISEGYGVRAIATSGIFLDFYTDSTYFAFSYDNIKQSSAREWYYFSLYINGEEFAQIGEEKQTLATGCYRTELPQGVNRITLFFPTLFRARLKKIELSDNASIETVEKKRKILFIGDSITQGYDVKYPADSYVNRFAYATDSEIINVGIGGSSFDDFWLEEKFVENPDWVFVALGTNAWRWQTKRQFAESSANFFQRLCAQYPDKPVFVLLPIWRQDTYSEAFQGTLVEAREILAKTAEVYSQIQVVDLWDKIPHDNGYYTDGLHPNKQGMQCFASGLLAELKERRII